MFKKKNKPANGSRRPSSQTNQSKQVFSYHSSRATPEPERARKDVFDQETVTANRNLKYIPTYIAILMIIASIFYLAILDVSNPQVITLAQTTPNILRDNDDYRKGFSGILSQDILNRSKLTIDTEKAAKQLEEAYPELEKVNIILPLVGKRPVVQISPAKPALALKTAQGVFVVGSNGKVLTGVDQLNTEQTKDLIFVEDKIATNIKPGSTVLPLSTIKFIQQLQLQMQAKQLAIESITLPVVANELHLKLEGKQYIIKFDLQNDVLQQAGSYFALSDYLAKNSQADPAQYIDVRIGERAYYK